MKKLEKLREINAILKIILIDLETYIFIENINIGDMNKTNKNELEVIVETKQ